MANDKPPEQLPEPAPPGGNGGLLPVIARNDAQMAVYNAVAVRRDEIVSELYKILKYRGRSCNIAASVHAGEILLGLIGLRPLGEGQGGTMGLMTINSSGPMQVVGNKGPDRLTQELIDIVRKGNNGGGTRPKPKEA